MVLMAKASAATAYTIRALVIWLHKLLRVSKSSHLLPFILDASLDFMIVMMVVAWAETSLNLRPEYILGPFNLQEDWLSHSRRGQGE